MRDVTYIGGKDHTYSVPIPDKIPFQVFFRADVTGHIGSGAAGGHYPEPKKQAKEGQATTGKWTRGVPEHVAEAWEANHQPGKSGFVIAPKAPAKKPAAAKPAAKKPAAKKAAVKK